MNCKNCKTELTDTSGYCNTCGGKVIRNRLTIKALFSHFSEEFLNYDNRFFQTFINLFRKPEDVIGSYINGTRKKYVNVISYFAIAITLSGLQIYIIQKFQVDLTMYDTTTEVGKIQQEAFSKIFKAANDYQSLIMMSYIPLYALIAKIVFFNIKKFNYTELLVVFLYAQAQISICLAILTVVFIPTGFIQFESLGVISLLFMLIYFAYCLKQVYKLSIQGIILRTLLFFGILLSIMIVLLVVVVVLAIVFKDSEFMKPFIEAQEAAKQAQGG